MNGARVLLGVLALSSVAVACRDANAAERGPALLIFGAASTTDVLSQLAADQAAVHVRTSFGPTSVLARQVMQGAPADVIVTASQTWMDYLAERGALHGKPRVVARNRLVCVAPRGSDLARAGVASAGVLLERLAGDARVALADTGVPAGTYARESLSAGGHLEALEPHVVGLRDVRAVLRAVVASEVAAGFVYATDARAGDVATLFELDPKTHAEVHVLAAVTRAASEHGAGDAALAWVAALAAPRARAAWSAAGFDVAGH